MNTVVAIHREPFSTEPFVCHVQEGETLEAIAARFDSLPEGWPRHQHDAICINGTAIPQSMWARVRPKTFGRDGRRIEVTIHSPPSGGDEGGGKQILSLVASIALMAAVGPVSNFAFTSLANAGVAVGRATALARLAGAAVVLAGNAVLQALSPTPSARQQDDGGRSELGSAGAQGNILEPNAPLPRVVGTRKVFPPFVTEPLIYYNGDDEVAEVLCALAGPHALSDIRVGAARIEDVQGIEFETREGWPGLDPLAVVSRYGRTSRVNSELRAHTVNEEDPEQLETNTGDIDDALPQAKVLATRDGPDSFWIGIAFPQGLFLNNADDKLLRVPLRIRIRQKGTTAWTNLPEIHYMAAHIGQKRATIKLTWRDGPVNVAAASTRGWVEARSFSPGQAINPTTDGWQAESYFDADTGGDHYVTSANSSGTDVTNIIMGKDTAEFQLDRATFPPGIYEVEIKRGYAFRDQDYSSSDYEIDSKVRDPFHYEGSGAAKIYQTKDKLSDKLFVVRANSVWDDAPVKKGDTALIAVKARNVNVDQLSVLASGYVRDWDGAAWTDWKTTSNPAPHLRDVFAGQLNATPLPALAIDDQSLVDLRAANWECNALLEGKSVGEAASVIASTGFAQIYQAEKFGIVRDRDRSADAPVQVFTPNNTAQFSWSRGYPKLPDGFRATFADANSDYEARQIIHPVGAARTEQVTIEGLVSEDDVRARLQYDLDTARYRSVFYTWDAASDAIKCRRGSLVGVASDVLSTRTFTGRVADFALDSNGDVTAIRLDTGVTLDAEGTWADIADMNTVENMALIGATFGAAVRQAGEVATTHQITASSLGDDWFDLATAISFPSLDYGDIVAVGALGREYRRLIVVDMTPKSLTDWTLTAVAEAPELWQ